MFPISGKNGYLSQLASIELPITRWNLFVSNQRTNYRTSYTDNYLNRNRGILVENITVSGVFGAQYLSSLYNVNEFKGQLGWIDWRNNQRVYIELDCIILRNTIELKYTSGNDLSIFWTANLFERKSAYKEVKTRPIPPYLDALLVCPTLPICSALIVSTDVRLQSLFSSLNIKHVQRATIIREREQLNYATSWSIPRTVDTLGVKEQRLDLTVQGYFDYWYSKVNWSQFAEMPDDYKFYYGTGVNDFILVDKMRTLSLDNVIANIQTAEMSSATVRLGAAH